MTVAGTSLVLCISSAVPDASEFNIKPELPAELVNDPKTSRFLVAGNVNNFPELIMRLLLIKKSVLDC